MTRSLAALLALLICLTVPGLGADASTSPTPQSAVSAKKAAKKAVQKYQRQAHRVTNGQRRTHDRRALKKQRCVQRFATRHAKAMAASRSMYHQELGPIMKRCGLRSVGENVAYGYRSGRAVVKDGWMNSPGHRANILNGDFTLMGIGARKTSDGRWYVAQVFGRKA